MEAAEYGEEEMEMEGEEMEMDMGQEIGNLQYNPLRNK
jgi:hypothetical protein